MESNKNKILELYFKKKLKQIEIAEILNISNNAVSKVLKKDTRFLKEKNYRKQLNKIRHNKEIQKRVEEKRKAKNNSDYQILKKMHEQASRELSGGRKPISNRAFRDWNTSIYRYNEKSKTYVLRKEINAGADVPNRISWKI